MLDREDMITLIRAVESLDRLNSKITSITNGYGIDGEEFDGLFEIYEVLKRNSRYSGSDDHDEDMFRAIIYAINKTSEEKYELLKTI